MELRRPSIEPTPEQRAIASERERRLIVEANAGAGKSTTLALRIREHLAAGGALASILALTFTAEACQAIRERLRQVGVPGDSALRIQVLTFDEFAARHLQKLQGRTRQITEPERVKPHVVAAVREARRSAQQHHPDAFRLDGEDLAVEGLLAGFAFLKGRMLLLREAEGRSLSPSLADDLGRDFSELAVHAAYEKHRCAASALDAPAFRWRGEATYDLAKLLIDPEETPYDEPGHHLRMDLGLLVVDEMHDMNRAMLTIVHALLEANPAARFVGVGDADQVLHEQNGADASLMRQDFDQQVGETKRLRLDLTYRFGTTLAQALGRFSNKRYVARDEQRCDVEVLAVASPEAQFEVIEKAVARRAAPRAASKSCAVAVLLRRPSLAVGLENHLLKRGLGYSTVGFKSYLHRPEALFVRGVLSVALDGFTQIEMPSTRERMVAAVRLFVGAAIETTVDNLQEQRLEEQKVLDGKLAHGDQFANYWRHRLLPQAHGRVRRAVEEALRIAADDRVEDLPAVLQALDLRWLASRVLVHAEAIDEVVQTCKGIVQGALEFDSIRSFLRRCDARELQLNVKRAEQLSLSTIEAAKGLEFDHVIVPQLDAQVFDGPSADERNRFYVAASRAKSRLTLLHTAGRPSTYLRAAGLNGSAMP